MFAPAKQKRQNLPVKDHIPHEDCPEVTQYCPVKTAK